MIKSNYLRLACELGLFGKKAWVVTAFSIVRSAVGADYHGKLIPQPWGYSFINQEGVLEKIEDAVPNQPLYTFADRVLLDPSWVPNITEPIDVPMGNLLFNKIAILSSYGAKFPFQKGKITVKNIEAIVAPKLQSTPEDESTRSDNFYYVDEMLKFNDALQYMSGFSQLATYAITRKGITPPTGVKEFKAKLLLKYGDTLTDPVQLSKFEGELLAFDDAYMKGDPSDGKFVSGKIKHTARKKLFLTLGADKNFTDSQKVTPVINSLEEGWPTDPTQFTAAMNGLRVGSYSRGAETVKGGVSAKYLLRAANNFRIVPTDCHSILGVRRHYDQRNVNSLIGRYVIDGKTLTLVENKDDAVNYLDKVVSVRSPMYCKLEGDTICEICAGRNLGKYPTGLTIPLTEISGIILATSLKAMHSNTVSTAKLHIAQAFS